MVNNIQALEQYFPTINKPIQYEEYQFIITIQQDKNTFIVNLKIRQQDTKQEHLIKFRLGIGKDHTKLHAAHETNKPHFEIDLYKREEETFSATMYFTFQEPNKEQILKYSKGTVSIINNILKQFLEEKNIPDSFLSNIIYSHAVQSELTIFEEELLDALYECYLNSDLIVRKAGEVHIIKTENKLEKFLNQRNLLPIYQPLQSRIEQKK
jgi:hypothetical protein